MIAVFQPFSPLVILYLENRMSKLLFRRYLLKVIFLLSFTISLPSWSIDIVLLDLPGWTEIDQTGPGDKIMNEFVEQSSLTIRLQYLPAARGIALVSNGTFKCLYTGEPVSVKNIYEYRNDRQPNSANFLLALYYSSGKY